MQDRYILFGSPKASHVFIQYVDDRDLSGIEREMEYVRKQTGQSDFSIVAVKVENWFSELAPWEAPPVFGKEPFGNGGEETLRILLQEILPQLENAVISSEPKNTINSPVPRNTMNSPEPKNTVNSPVPRNTMNSPEPKNTVNSPEQENTNNSPVPENSDNITAPGRRYYLCGYSLAGLFALWGAYQTPVFSGVAAASPSVWYPNWIAYAQQHEIQTEHVYLSLGLKEEKTRNQTMAAVGDCIRTMHTLLCEKDIQNTLEWNPGNHFVDSDLRMAKGMVWLLQQKDNLQ